MDCLLILLLVGSGALLANTASAGTDPLLALARLALGSLAVRQRVAALEVAALLTVRFVSLLLFNLLILLGDLLLSDQPGLSLFLLRARLLGGLFGLPRGLIELT